MPSPSPTILIWGQLYDTHRQQNNINWQNIFTCPVQISFFCQLHGATIYKYIGGKILCDPWPQHWLGWECYCKPKLISLEVRTYVAEEQGIVIFPESVIHHLWDLSLLHIHGCSVCSFFFVSFYWANNVWSLSWMFYL